MPIRFADDRLEINVHLHAPDKRLRDIDNVLKPLLDALVHAGLFNDDSQVDLITIDRKSTRLNSSHMSESRMPSSA